MQVRTVEGESSQFCEHLNSIVLNAPTCNLLRRQLSTIAGSYPRRPVDCPVEGMGHSCQVVSAYHETIRDTYTRSSK